MSETVAVGERFDRRAGTYDRSASHRWQSQQAVDHLGPRPGWRVLDVAAGTGLEMRAALPLIGEHGRLVGADIAVAMLSAGRAAAADPRCAWVGADAAALPFLDDSFDALLCVAGVPYVPDPVAALGEWRRVARPGAPLVVTLPPPDGLTIPRVLRRAAAGEGLELPDPGGPLADPAQRPGLLADGGWLLESADQVTFTQALPDARTAFRFVESGFAEPLRLAGPEQRHAVWRRFQQLHAAETVEVHQVLRLRLRPAPHDVEPGAAPADRAGSRRRR